MAARVKVIDLAKELGVTSKDLIVALEGMGHKGMRAMSPLLAATANELRVKLGRGRDLPAEAKPKRAPKPKAAEGDAPAAAPKKKAAGAKKGAAKSAEETPEVDRARAGARPRRGRSRPRPSSGPRRPSLRPRAARPRSPRLRRSRPPPRRSRRRRPRRPGPRLRRLPRRRVRPAAAAPPVEVRPAPPVTARRRCRRR